MITKQKLITAGAIIIFCCLLFGVVDYLRYKNTYYNTTIKELRVHIIMLRMERDKMFDEYTLYREEKELPPPDVETYILGGEM